jgi:ABC-type branched-subunit amino acid transport system ATPase component
VAALNPLGLTVEAVSLAFGGVTVLRDVSFEVKPGTITSLIGPNGAGKSSMVNVITRLYQPQAGAVAISDEATTQPLLGRAPHELARLGIARTFQNLQLVPALTAAENVLVGRHRHMRSGPTSIMVGLRSARREEREHRAVCTETLRFLGLADVADRPVASLPYGIQKRVELARALVAKPRLLLLDEPAAGLNESESDELREFLAGIAATSQEDRKSVV